jgi:carbonic anhydrase
VHRNIANVVHADDVNAASVVEYAVTHLKVQKVVVCGHTRCGGAIAALGDADLGQTLNTWLHPVREYVDVHIYFPLCCASWSMSSVPGEKSDV